jgi:putative transport protein
VIEILASSPLLLLFVVIGIGYPIGQIKLGGVSLGVSAVLFAGIIIGAFDQRLKVPTEYYELGLVLFVYTIGISSGATFFSSLQKRGLGYNTLVLGTLLVSTALTAGLSFFLNIKSTIAVGTFAGSLTNTPALAASLETIKAARQNNDQLLAEPVVGYSITYPFGVIGMILAMVVLQRLWKVDYAKEAESLPELGGTKEPLINRTILVTRTSTTAKTIHAMMHENSWTVVFGRLKRNGEISLSSGNTTLEIGDLVSVIGKVEEVEHVTAYLGETSNEMLDVDRSQLDYRRIFVSNPAITGFPLKQLNLPQHFGALITRVRRGDFEFLASGNTVLELGDRIRVITKRENMPAVTKFFGDSYKSLSEIDIVTFSVGVGLGLIIGSIPIPIPGLGTLKLGIAGGPLLVSLILGALRRTGPIVWQMPYSANLTIRQFGLVLFLAGIGTRAGYPFVSTFANSGGVTILLVGLAITLISALLCLVIGYKLLKIPYGVLIGILAGFQTQPALLAFAQEQAKNDLPNIGYSTVYPVALISKIILAQTLITLLL